MNESFMSMVEREYVSDQYEQLKPQIRRMWGACAFALVVTLAVAVALIFGIVAVLS